MRLEGIHLNNVQKHRALKHTELQFWYYKSINWFHFDLILREHFIYSNTKAIQNLQSPKHLLWCRTLSTSLLMDTELTQHCWEGFVRLGKWLDAETAPHLYRGCLLTQKTSFWRMFWPCKHVPYPTGLKLHISWWIFPELHSNCCLFQS